MTRLGIKAAVAALAAVLGALGASAQAPANTPTPEQVELFASFYHDSINEFFKVLGEELLNMPMDQFEVLPYNVRHRACPAIVDQMAYRAFTFKAFHATHARQTVLELMERAKKARGFLFKDLKRWHEAISEKAEHCLENGIVHVGFATFTEGAYADTRSELALNALYESQVPFVRWVWSSVEPSEERENLRSLIESMERKYIIEISSP